MRSGVEVLDKINEKLITKLAQYKEKGTPTPPIIRRRKSPR
jgi:hypothetical protein